MGGIDLTDNRSWGPLGEPGDVWGFIRGFWGLLTIMGSIGVI